MLAEFPEVKILAKGGAEIQLSHVGKKVRVDFFYLISARRMISPVALISMDPLVQLREGWWISAERVMGQWRYFNND
jgi:hypothetical protein